MVDLGQTATVQGKIAGVIGVGWRFPFRFSSGTGGVGKSSQVSVDPDIQHIRDSISQILATVVGERVMRRGFASLIRERTHDPIDETTILALRSDIVDAIVRNERRVRLQRLDFSQSDTALGRLDISVSFLVVRTQQPGNLVFPFFLEGAEV